MFAKGVALRKEEVAKKKISLKNKTAFMPSPNEDWYSHLVAQSRNDNIYSLIHSFLTPDWEPNHDLDFVAVRQNELPEKLKTVPANHLSKKLKKEAYCFPGNDYLLLDNYQLTEYLFYAKWAKMIEDFEGRKFIELCYVWNNNAQELWDNPPAFAKVKSPYNKETRDPLPQRDFNRMDENEKSLAYAYELLKKGENRETAMQHAIIGKEFLDTNRILFTGQTDMVLQDIIRQMIGYNIIAMVFAWNDQFNLAAEADQNYIHNPVAWSHLEPYIIPYLEMLTVKKKVDYLNFLFSDMAFQKRFFPHYDVFISLFINDQHEIRNMQEFVKIVNRVNNVQDCYK